MRQNIAKITITVAIVLLFVAALVIPALILDETAVSKPWDTVAYIADWAIWLAFAIEMAVMLIVVRQRGRYLLHSPVELAIVVLTMPLLPGMLSGIRVMRLIRITRVLRVLRLLRLAPIFRRVFTLEGVKYATLVTALVVLTGGAAYESAEPGKGYFDGVYWAVTTMTTTGYGDELPTTPLSKAFAIGLMLVGFGFLAVLTGSVAERFIQREEVQLLSDGEEESGSEDRDLDAEVRRLTARARELVLELEVLREQLADERDSGP
jgi:voltage-gated potassium channel